MKNAQVKGTLYLPFPPRSLTAPLACAALQHGTTDRAQALGRSAGAPPKNQMLLDFVFIADCVLLERRCKCRCQEQQSMTRPGPRPDDFRLKGKLPSAAPW